MRIQILSTTPHFGPGKQYINLAEQAKKIIEDAGFPVERIEHHDQIQPVFLCLIIGYYKIIPEEKWTQPKYCLGIHNSPLPKGRGQAPLNWAIINGEKQCGVSLFKMAREVDSGDLLDQRIIPIEPWETFNEIKTKCEKTILDIVKTTIIDFLRNPSEDKFKPQKGTPTYYPRRTPGDSRFNHELINQELFNHLRACDNQLYPAWFKKFNRKYHLKLIPSEKSE